MRDLSTTGFRHRLFAGLLALGILALVVSTISLVINQAVRGKPASAVATLPVGAQPVSFTSFLSSYIAHGGHNTKAMNLALSRPYVTFTAGTFDPSTDALVGTLAVVLPPGLPPRITDAKGNSVFEADGVTPKPRYANDQVTVKVLVTRTAVNKEIFFTIPMKNFIGGSNLGLHEFPLTVPMNGYAGWYPQDQYSTTLTVALALPAGWGPNTDAGSLSTVHTVDGGTVADNYDFAVQSAGPKFNRLESNALDTFNISISRDWYNQFFVFAVAVIPILFALLFFHLLFIAGGRHGIGRSFEHFTEALVVSILSVLPLRVVLVPGDISGLTRVDLVLGIGLVLIVAVAAGKYAREIWVTGGAEGARTEPEAVLLRYPTSAEAPVTAREERWAEEDAMERAAQSSADHPAVAHAEPPSETPQGT